MPVSYGIYVICWFGEDDAPEPEGTVIFDHYPKIGDQKILSDGHVYEVFRVHEDLKCDMQMIRRN